jgi:hypothetical protein
LILHNALRLVMQRQDEYYLGAIPQPLYPASSAQTKNQQKLDLGFIG